MRRFTEKIYNRQDAINEYSLKEQVTDYKVSVIVPVYNTEEYIFKCLMSLIRQTLKEIEIIIVNDGSTDSSASIISMFQKADSRIKVINQENKLQGAARNSGMKIANGEYIGFVDSDDWVDLDYFEKLYNTAKKYNSDIALATNVRIGNGKTKKRLNIEKEEFVTSLQDKIDICQQWKNECPTNKIYRHTLLKDNKIVWQEGCYCEDKLFTIQTVYYANGIVTVPNIYYYYFRNPNSTVNLKKRKHFKRFINDKNAARCSVIRFLKEKSAQIRDKDFWSVNKECRLFGVAWWEKRESLYTKEALLFGLPLLTVEDTNDYRIQNFAGGLIYTKKLKSNIKEQKLYKFLGIPISERITEDDICKYYCFGHLTSQFHLADLVFKGHLKKVHFNYDDIYLLHSNSGEAYLFFAYLAKAFLKKNGSKNPLFVATKKYHIEILKLYFPEAQYIYIDESIIKTQSDHWIWNGHNIYIIFSSNHFQKVEIDIKNNEIGKIHYLKSILKTLGLQESDYCNVQPSINYEIRRILEEKINKIGLNLNNFIILVPEALTYEELPASFWNKLANKLSQMGYDIFINLTDSEYDIDGCKSTLLTHRELFCLAEKAKAVISLRSGLTEFLLSANVPNIAIYTKFRKRNIRNAFSVDKTIAGFSMLELPFVSKNKIAEINADEFLNEEDLLNRVLEALKAVLYKEECLV